MAQYSVSPRTDDKSYSHCVFVGAAAFKPNEYMEGETDVILFRMGEGFAVSDLRSDRLSGSDLLECGSR